MPSQKAIGNKALNDQELAEERTILASKPQRLVFETTNRCNLRCAMCGQSHRDFVGRDLKPEVFYRTEPHWDTAHDASLFGWGEPLMNKHLGEYFDALAPRGPRIFVLTNAMLLKDKMIERFLAGGLSFLNFSVDGARAATYNRIRKGADFDTVVANIAKVVARKRALGVTHPHMRMVFVGMRSNVEEFPDFVDMAARLGMDEAKMVHMIAYGREMVDEILFGHKELTNAVLDEAERRAKAHGLKLTIPDRFDLSGKAAMEPAAALHKKCPRPWEEVFVQSDGKVRLCMLSKDIMGDLNVEGVEDIWNNEEFQKVRATINTPRATSTCAKCPQYKEMNVNDRAAFIQVDTTLPGTKSVKGVPQPGAALAEAAE
jgi:radical SAM protein with 4Fe4S-binding SPASM domain